MSKLTDSWERDSIIDDEADVYDEKPIGGIKRFTRLATSGVNELERLNLIDINERQNNAPSIAEFQKFANEHPNNNISFDGYTVVPERNDCRISIDAIQMSLNDYQDLSDFVELCKGHTPDELNTENNQLRAWWD